MQPAHRLPARRIRSRKFAEFTSELLIEAARRPTGKQFRQAERRYREAKSLESRNTG